jgi:hypothetical protein
MTGEIKSKIDAVRNAFWAGGIANPLEVIEQITYLLFLRRLDDLHTLEENKAARLKQPMARRVFPGARTGKARAAGGRSRTSGTTAVSQKTRGHCQRTPSPTTWRTPPCRWRDPFAFAMTHPLARRTNLAK